MHKQICYILSQFLNDSLKPCRVKTVLSHTATTLPVLNSRLRPCRYTSFPYFKKINRLEQFWLKDLSKTRKTSFTCGETQRPCYFEIFYVIVRIPWSNKIIGNKCIIEFKCKSNVMG